MGTLYGQRACFTDNKCNSNLFIAKSVDGGFTWTPLSVFRQGGLVPQLATWIFHDKPAMVIDSTGGSCNGRIYVTWARFDGQTLNSPRSIHFAYSTDGGINFPDEVEKQLGPIGTAEVPAVAVGSDGAVYISWVDPTQPPGATSNVQFAKSTDCGGTFAAPSAVQSLTLSQDFGSRPPIQAIAIDPENPSLVYVVYSDFPSGSGSGGEIRFTRSTNRGQSWSAPLTLNDIQTGEQFLPAISVTGGRIDVIWYDGRNSQTGTFVDVFYAKSLDQGKSFITSQRINDLAIPTESAAGFLGHYIGIASALDAAFPVWTGQLVQEDSRDIISDKITFPDGGGSGGGGGGCHGPCPRS